MTARWAPTQAELLAASARTSAALADPDMSLADVELVAELEEAAYGQIEPGPCDRPGDPPLAQSRIDWSPELAAEAGAEAGLEAAI